MNKILIIFHLLVLNLTFGCGKKDQLKLNAKSKGKLNTLILGKIIAKDLEGLKKILDKEEYNLNEIDGDKTYLIFALNTQNEEIINLLIEKGADPNLVIKGKSILLYGLENKKEEGSKTLIRNGKFKIDQKNIVEVSKIVITNEYTDILALLIEKGLDINTEIEGKTLLKFCLSIMSPKPKSALAIITNANLYQSSSLIVELMNIYKSLISFSLNDAPKKEMLEIIKQKFKEEASWESNQFNKEEIKKIVLNRIVAYDELNEEMNILLNERVNLNAQENIETNNLLIVDAIKGTALKNILDLKESIINLDNKSLNNLLIECIILNSKMSPKKIDIISLDKVLEQFSIMGATFHPIKIEKFKLNKTMKPAEMFKLKVSTSTENLLLYLINIKNEILETVLKHLNLDNEEIKILIDISLNNFESFKIVINFFNKILKKEEILEIILSENVIDDLKIAQIKYAMEQNFEIEDRKKFTKYILNLIRKPFFIIFKESRDEFFRGNIEKSKGNKREALKKAILIDDIILLERIVDIFEISLEEIDEYNKEFNLLDNAIKEGKNDLAKYLIKNNVEIISTPNIIEFIKKYYVSEFETLINNVKNNHFNVVKFILDKNIISTNIRYIDDQNKSVLDYIEDKNNELYNYLRAKNAKTAEEIIKEVNKNQSKKKPKEKKVVKSHPISNEKNDLLILDNSNIQTENKLTFKDAVKNRDLNLIKNYIKEDSKRIFEILDKSDLIKELLELIDIKTEDENGDNILFAAIRNSHLNTVKILISSGKFDIKDRDKNGNSILMLSIPLQSADIFKYLINISKDILNFENNKNKNILDIAIENRKNLIVNLILINKDFIRKDQSKTLINLIFSKEEQLKLQMLKTLMKEGFNFEKEDIEKIIERKEEISENIKDLLKENGFNILKIKNKKYQVEIKKFKIDKIEINRKIKIYNNSNWEVLENSLSNEEDYKYVLEELKELARNPLKDMPKMENTDNIYKIKIRRTRVFFIIHNQEIIIIKTFLSKDEAKTNIEIENAKEIVKNIKNGEYENKLKELKFD